MRKEIHEEFYLFICFLLFLTSLIWLRFNLTHFWILLFSFTFFLYIFFSIVEFILCCFKVFLVFIDLFIHLFIYLLIYLSILSPTSIKNNITSRLYYFIYLFIYLFLFFCFWGNLSYVQKFQLSLISFFFIPIQFKYRSLKERPFSDYVLLSNTCLTETLYFLNYYKQYYVQKISWKFVHHRIS